MSKTNDELSAPMWLWIVVLAILIASCAATCAGCVARGAIPGCQSPTEVAATQQGALNAATGDVTGISWSAALPAGLFPLLAFQVYLSHKREVLRIENGRKA